jgi:hypothetical protein
VRTLSRWPAALVVLVVMGVPLLLGSPARAQAQAPQATWTQLTADGAPGAPGARLSHAAAWDAQASRLLVFGGFDGTGFRNDLWEYTTGGGWRQLVGQGAAGAPAPRDRSAAVWDGQANRLLLFGGAQGDGTVFNDLWEYTTGGGWRQLVGQGAAGAPAKRVNAVAAWDGQANRLLLFAGGDYGVGASYNDLWEYTTGGGWRLLTANDLDAGRNGSPPALPYDRIGASGVWDTQASRLLVFGGWTGGLLDLNDLWEYTTGGGWRLLTPLRAATAPLTRDTHTAVWDGQANRMLVFGGWAETAPLNDLWQYTGAGGWSQLIAQGAAGAPAARVGHKAAWDAQASRLLVFGGGNYATTAFYNDLWQYATSSPTFRLSGRVTDQPGNAVGGATLDALSSGTSTAVASATTAPDGSYAVSVVGGTYDVRVTPPTGSGFQATSIVGRLIASNTTLDIVLVRPLQITTPSTLLSGTVGSPYSTPLQAQGGAVPYTWSIASGDLPPGLGLDATTGVISGTPTAAGTYGFTVRVTDSVSVTVTKPFALEPPPPAGAAGAAYSLPVTASGVGASNCTITVGTLPPGLTLDPAMCVIGGTPTNGGTYTVTIQSTSGGQTATKEFTITITNPVPVLSGLNPTSATEGDPPFTLTATGTNFVLSSVVQWNGVARPTTYVSATELRAAVPASDIAAPGTATVTVVNPAPGSATSNAKDFAVNRRNRPPVAAAGPDQMVNEGATVALDARGSSDPDGDALTYTWTVMNCPWPVTFSAPGQATTTFVASDDGVCTLRVTVTDGKLDGTARDDVSVTVKNVAPTVRPITAPIDPVRLGTAVTAKADVTDPGVRDTHTAAWDWGDGTNTPGTVTEANGSGSVTGTRSYAAPGVYTVKLTVTDKDGGSGTAVFQYVVVYDPSGGFATGGGWITSPTEACRLNTACQGATGKATFGFVAKYKKGADVPDGETEFQFQTGGLNFQSTAYDWLVIAGAKAQYKGTGTINGAGTYGFLLTVVDGQTNGGSGVDKFRIKIWEKASGVVVYDNQLGVPDDADPATVLGSGSIVIHKN